MRCVRCETDNRPDSLVCATCSVALVRACPSCGHRSEPAARFCPQCGTSLGDPTSTAVAPTAPATIDGELKQTTVLFADVSGSTSFIESLDPEEADKRLTPLVEAMKGAVQRFDGSVVRVQGDGIMAVFGAPSTQEDHAVRACGAALAMQEAVKAMPGNAPGIRVGIHSGEVLARTAASDFDATGINVHIARRLEELAPVGGIALSLATLRSTGQFVTVQSIGTRQLRGLSAPLEIFILTGLQRDPTKQRFTAKRARSVFVGRDVELALLEKLRRSTADGRGRVVGVVAEAGVGKSRLCFEFARRCRARGVPFVQGRAFAHSRATPYAPVIDVWKDFFEITHDDPPERAREKVAARMARFAPSLMESSLPSLLDFLGLSEAGSEWPKFDPETRRERLNRLFRPLLRAIADYRARGVILLEDLHWMDPGSESMLELFVEVVRNMPFLLIVNYRPGYSAPWMRGDRYDQISLAPLRHAAADSLAVQLLGDDESVRALLPLIADRAQGNPLFIEELVRKFEESGYLAGERGAYHLLRMPDMRLVPDTVQAIIGARIDGRPEAEKSIIQAAAVIGREFAMSVLARLVGEPVARLDGALRRLSAAGLVFQSGAGKDLFAFTHPMVQEVAYRSLLSERRRSLHASVAAELEKTLPDPGGGQAGLIAYHWEEAGNPMQAASYNIKAATWYGTPDLARPLAWHGTRDPTRALDAWKQARRLMIELPLEGQAKALLIWADAQILSMGRRSQSLTAADAEPYYREAMALARAMGETRLMVLVTLIYAWLQEAGGLFANIVAPMDEVLTALDDRKDASLKVLLTANVGHMLRIAGDLPRALQAMDEALGRMHEVAEIDKKVLDFQPASFAKAIRGRILAMMGRCDEARPLLDKLYGSGEPFVRMHAHYGCIDIAWGLNDIAQASVHLDMATRLAKSSGHPSWMATCDNYAGLVQAMRGEYSLAIETLSSALERLRRSSRKVQETRVLADLAYAQLCAGLIDQARLTAGEAASSARRRGMKVWLAYAEWVMGGPTSPAFRKLVAETDANLLMRLRYPRT